MYTPGMIRLGTGEHRRWTALILVAFFAAGIHQGGAAQVLCIGEDGHVEVETSGVDCCAESDESHGLERGERIAAANDPDTDDCGACIDIPLVTSGRIAVEPVSVNRSDVSVCAADTIVATNHARQLAVQPEHIFGLHLSSSYSATLPLLL